MKRPTVAELERRIAEGRALLAWLEREGIQFKQLAADLGVSGATVSAWVNGELRISPARREQLRARGFGKEAA